MHTTGLSFVHGKAAKMATFLEALGCWATTTRASLAAARFLRSLLIGCEAHLSQRSHRLLVTCVAYGVRSFGFCALSLRIRLGEAKRCNRDSPHVTRASRESEEATARLWLLWSPRG